MLSQMVSSSKFCHTLCGVIVPQLFGTTGMISMSSRQRGMKRETQACSQTSCGYRFSSLHNPVLSAQRNEFNVG